MILDLCDEALEYGRQTARALEAAGGDALVQAAEADPSVRERSIASVLDGLGAWQLDVWGVAEELEAAAAVCRAAGSWGLPYPVAERMCRPAGSDVDGLLVVAGPLPAGPVAGLDRRWAAVTLDGRMDIAVARPADRPPRRSAFVAPLDLLEPVAPSSSDPADPSDSGGAERRRQVALGLVLPCWTLLGMLDRAVALTCGYVQERRQFGQPLASFQGVQFQLTDAEVERAGLEELAKYALWSIQTGRPDALADALALRLAALEAAEIVFRVAHQLHGAIGFCDETTLSWISRYSAPLRRLPLGLSATRVALTAGVDRRGLAGLFGPAGGR